MVPSCPVDSALVSPFVFLGKVCFKLNQKRMFFCSMATEHLRVATELCFTIIFFARNGFTPLHLGAQRGHLEVVQCLLTAKADKDKGDQQGATPMHSAALSGHSEVVCCLLDAGAQHIGVWLRIVWLK